MVANGNPLGPSVAGGRGAYAVDSGQEARHQGGVGRDMEDEKDRGGSTPAGTRLLIRSSPDRGSVLLHLDQHFIERESYRSGRDRTLEISGRGRNAGSVTCPMCCVLANKAPGLYNQLSLLPSGSRTRARGEGDTCTPLNWPPDLGREALSARDCLRDSQAICSFQESLRTIIINKDINNKDRNHLQRTGEVSKG
jgi:hypothetical protein